MVSYSNTETYPCQYVPVFYLRHTKPYFVAMGIKDNLKRLMDAAGDNAYTLADKSGVPQPTIQRILTGKHSDPRTATIQRLADAYKISIAVLRGEPAPENNKIQYLPDDLRNQVEWLIANADEEIRVMFAFLVHAAYTKKTASKEDDKKKVA